MLDGRGWLHGDLAVSDWGRHWSGQDRKNPPPHTQAVAYCNVLLEVGVWIWSEFEGKE
jgi:hypothetical protein